MKIPKTVRIFGQDIAVVQLRLDDETSGLFEPDTATIFICDSLNSHLKKITLVHEMTHALACRLNWIGSMSPEQVEFVCDHVGVMIAENFELKILNK